jgi:hypothetical protein
MQTRAISFTPACLQMTSKNTNLALVEEPTIFNQPEPMEAPKGPRIKTLGYLGYGTGHVSPFDQVFEQGQLVEPEHIDERLDALVIWGGEDISPSIYNHAVSSYTGAFENLSRRDRIEVEASRRCIDLGIPLIGVCRGAQLLCALAGGYLIQHVSNHGVSHLIEDKAGHKVLSSSVHHQMMYPYDVEHELIAWASPRRSTTYIVGSDLQNEEMHEHEEPEIVWFPKIKGLAIQGHPEFHGRPLTDPFVQYCMELVRKYIVK